MAYVRKLPSGKWQATVYLPDKRRRTYTSTLKGEVKEWATQQETRIRRGDWLDPKVARVLYEDWFQRWWDARVVEDDTRRGDRTVVRKWLDPHWRGRPLASITRMDVQSWVSRMQRDGGGPAAIRRAYHLFTSLMGAAALEGIVPQTPCRKIDLPPLPPKAPAWYTLEQVRAIIDELPERHAAGVALMCWAGLRWGEMAGLRVQDVDYERGRVKVVGTRTQFGKYKAYPKSSKSRREVPCPGPVLEMLRRLSGDRGLDEPVFTTVHGSRPWSGANWRLVWFGAVERAGVPRHPPHTCRHTAASWLVQAGVDLYRVQALLGHESFATTQKYAHLAPDAHSEVEAAWVRISAPMAIEAREYAVGSS